MSVELLLEDLRRKSRQRIAACWQRAEDEAAALQAELAAEVAAAAELQARQRRAEEREMAEPILRAAEIEALRIEDRACRELGDRLHALATGQLDRVREEGYSDLFAALAAELPEVSWTTVRVHPQDQGLAAIYFPGAEIQGDPAVAGGFAAECDQGRYRVVSTLERRLERAWPFVLPLLLKEIGEGGDAAPAG